MKNQTISGSGVTQAKEVVKKWVDMKGPERIGFGGLGHLTTLIAQALEEQRRVLTK